MIIIVEGIDRVGKTTLCNKLHDELHIPIYKHNNEQFDYSKMDNENETDKMLQLIDLHKMLHGSVIFDRFHWSDFVYGIMNRHYDIGIAADNLHKIDCALTNAAIIYVKPTNILESSRQHGFNLTLYSELMDYCDRYSFTKVYKCTYNTIDNAIEEIKHEYWL